MNHHHFIATSSNGEELLLINHSLDDARYTAAELFNEPVDAITIYHKDEW